MNAAPSLTLVFDSSVLSCFARAGRLDVLRILTEGHQRVVTRAVLEELQNGIPQFPQLRDVRECAWIEAIRSDSLEEMSAFSHYVSILGCGDRDVGEAATLAWAESHRASHRAIAVLDDQAGVNAGNQRGVRIKRTLALVSTGVGQGVLTEDDAASLVDELISGGARFPCDGRRFIPWCKDKGLLA